MSSHNVPENFQLRVNVRIELIPIFASDKPINIEVTTCKILIPVKIPIFHNMNKVHNILINTM